MLICTDRPETCLQPEAAEAPPAPVLLRTNERRWFGSSERVFNPQATRAELLRPRSTN